MYTTGLKFVDQGIERSRGQDVALIIWGIMLENIHEPNIGGQTNTIPFGPCKTESSAE